MTKKSQKETKALEPIEIMEITSLEVLKILADPFRIQILESLRGYVLPHGAHCPA